MTARLPSPRRMTDREIRNEKRRIMRVSCPAPEAVTRLGLLIIEQHRRTAARKRARKGER